MNPAAGKHSFWEEEEEEAQTVLGSSGTITFTQKSARFMVIPYGRAQMMNQEECARPIANGVGIAWSEVKTREGVVGSDDMVVVLY